MRFVLQAFWETPGQSDVMTEVVARPEGWRRAHPLLAAALVAGLLSVTLSVVPLPDQVALAFANGLQVMAAATAAFFCILEGRRKSGAARAGWLLIGAGAACWTAGQVAWTWYELQGRDVPLPSVADVGYLAMYPLAVCGILALSTLVGRPWLQRAAVLLDGLLSALAIFVLAWPFLLDPTFDAMGGRLDAYLTVAYPLGDVLLVGLLGGILLRGRSTWRSGRGLALAAFACILVADLGLATGIWAGNYATGQLADAGWIVGFLLLAAGARAPPPALAVASSRHSSIVTRWLPIAVLGAAAAAIFLVLQVHEHTDQGWRLSMGLLFLGTGAHYAMTEREHAMLKADFRSLFANMTEGFAHCRMVFEDGVPVDWVYLDVNASFASLTGLADVVGKPVSAVAPGIRGTNPALFAMYGRLARGGPPERIETEVPGLGRWFAVSAYAAGPDEFVAVFDDITQRKRSEATLLASESRLREAQAIAHVGDWELDLVGTRLAWSDETYRIFEADPASFQATYRAFLAGIHPDDRARVDQAYRASIAGRTPYSVEHRLLLKGGRIKHVLERGRTDYDAAGRPVRSVGTVLDLTEQKLAEQARREGEAKDLEVKRLEELNRMRIDFLNTAAHDLMTPLTPLKLQMATLRIKGNLDAAQRASLALMDRNVNRFKVLVEDMLDAARLQAGRLRLRIETLAIAPLVAEAAASFQETAKEGQVIIEVAALPDVEVTADPSKAMQVFMNVVSNALKYTSPGGHVRIRVEATGTEAVVAVEDSGLGMTADQISHLFQPFVRLHEDLANVAKGTGLGLYISKGIVESHGGRMWAESPGPGQGTTFYIAWPLAGTTPPVAGPAAA